MPAEPYYSFTVRIKASLHDRLKALANEYDMSIPKLLLYFAETELEYLEKKDKE